MYGWSNLVIAFKAQEFEAFRYPLVPSNIVTWLENLSIGSMIFPANFFRLHG
jgi:hypothetical protein